MKIIKRAACLLAALNVCFPAFSFGCRHELVRAA